MAVSNVASSTSAALLLAASSRRTTLICNSDANDLYILLGTPADGTAAASNMSAIIVAKDCYRLPEGYTGPVYGVWAADGSGYAHVTTY